MIALSTSEISSAKVLWYLENEGENKGENEGWERWTDGGRWRSMEVGENGWGMGGDGCVCVFVFVCVCEMWTDGGRWSGGGWK